jgi:(2R)-sulfolactate sulfo-lyase subunit alpha
LNNSTIQFIVHGENDTVGVAVQDLSSGQQANGWNMQTGAMLSEAVREDIPLGHKIALTAFSEGDHIVKYNQPIGNTTQKISQGGHVHTHNLKTARW